MVSIYFWISEDGWAIYFPHHFFPSYVLLFSIQQGVLEPQESTGENSSQAGESRGGQRGERPKRNEVPWICSLLNNNNNDDQTFFFFPGSFVVCEEDQQQNQTWAQACSFSASPSFPLALPALPCPPLLPTTTTTPPPPPSPTSLHFIKPRILELAIKTSNCVSHFLWQ